jgi:gamma-glutamyl-gamma-aminobutyraldehyde dehydrogenase
VITQAFIGGDYVDAAEGATFPSVNPATGETLAEVAACGAEDVDRAVRAARAAFEGGVWADATERKRVLLRLVALIGEHADELARLDSLDMGKLLSDAQAFDVPGSAAVLEFYAEAIDKRYGEIAPTADLALIQREPLGVVGAVVPWNYPLEMACWKLGPALAAGNSVVLKPAEQSPLSAIRLAELAAEAGMPEGVLNVVPGLGPDAGKALGLHPDVDCIVFTGSTDVGKLFPGYAGASNLKQVWPECGGKSANLIFADVEDLDAAAEKACFGAFFNQGQVCSANSRLLVERSIKDELLERLAARARELRPRGPAGPRVALRRTRLGGAHPARDGLHRGCGRATARRQAGARQRTRLLRRAHDLRQRGAGYADRPRGDLRSRPGRHRLRLRRRGRAPRQRLGLWPCRVGLDRQPVPRPPCRAPAARGNGERQHR